MFGKAGAAVVENVSYTDGNFSLSGYLAYPDTGTGVLPVLLHVPTSWGLRQDVEVARAQRTADELNMVGFAVSIWADTEHAGVGGARRNDKRLGQVYYDDPALFASRLNAAVEFLRARAVADAGRTGPRVDATRIAAAGYGFGGTAVLHYAELGGASAAGVGAVFCFAGGLVHPNPRNYNSSFGGVRVFVLNGAADGVTTYPEVLQDQAHMTAGGAQWEFTLYGHARQGYTIGMKDDGTPYERFDPLADRRSWESMRDGLKGLGYLGNTSTTPAGSVVTENVTFNDSGVILSGFLAYPQGATGPLPAVLHAHTWAGLSDFERERAIRTASELGHIGFAPSLYTDAQNAQAQSGGFAARAAIVGGFTPELHVSRISAAVAFLRGHSLADPSRVGAAGYCFGGTAVLQYARMGAAQADGVVGVASFHGGLNGMDAFPRKYCPTRVAIFNGAEDTTIPGAQIHSLVTALESSQTQWEFTNYSHVGHGFTHPRDGTSHFQYDQVAEQRSWVAMAGFFNDTFGGLGRTNASACVHDYGSSTSNTPGGGCVDDHAGLAAVGGAYGITRCEASYCNTQFASMVQPLCPLSCGLCSPGTTAGPGTTSGPGTTAGSTTTGPVTTTEIVINGAVRMPVPALVPVTAALLALAALPLA